VAANAGCTGALVGALMGYHNLPVAWLQKLPHLQALNEIVTNFLGALKLKE